jgi:hypothetical protein
MATQHINRVSRNSFHSLIEAKLGIEHWAGGRLHIDQAVPKHTPAEGGQAEAAVDGMAYD